MRSLFATVAMFILGTAQTLADPELVDRQGDRLPPGAIARFGSSRLRHPGLSGEDDSFVFRPDSRAIATWNGTSVRLWNLADDARMVWNFSLRVTPRLAVFSPDGTRLAVIAGDDVLLIDTASGKLQQTLKGVSSTAFAFSPDGKSLATARREPQALIELWNLDTAIRIHAIPIAGDGVDALALTADGSILRAAVAESRDGSTSLWIRRWDVTTAAPGPGFRVPGPAGLLRLNTTGRILATSSRRDDLIQVWDVDSGREISQIQCRHRNFDITADGKSIVTVIADPSARTARVSFWDVATGRQLREFPISRNFGEFARISPEGTLFATGNRGQMVTVWDAQNGRRRFESSGHNEQVTSVAFTRAGTTLISRAADMRLWDIATGELVEILPARSRRVALVADRNEFVAGTEMLCRYDLLTGRTCGDPLATPILPGRLSDDTMEISPSMIDTGDGEVVAEVLLRGPQRRGWVSFVVNWNIATGQITIVYQIPEGVTVEALAASPGRVVLSKTTTRVADGAVALAGFPTAWSTDLSVVELATGRESMHMRIPETAFFRVAIARTGHRLAVVTAERGAVPALPASRMDLRLWDTEQNRERWVVGLKSPGHYDPNVLVFSPDGRRIAISRADGRIEVFETKRGQEVAVREGSDSASYALEFDPAGRRLASGHADGTVLLWDIPAPSDVAPE